MLFIPQRRKPGACGPAQKSSLHALVNFGTISVQRKNRKVRNESLDCGALTPLGPCGIILPGQSSPSSSLCLHHDKELPPSEPSRS